MMTFYRDQLKHPQARKFYDAMLASVEKGNTGGIFTLDYNNRRTASQDGFDAIRALRCDRPDFFFLSRTTQALFHQRKMVLMNKALYTPQQILKIRYHLNQTLAEITAGTAGRSAWDRERIIYERLIRRLSYADHGTDAEPKEYDHNIVGPLLQDSGVCEGFSCLLMLALRRAGIPCIRVSGYADKEAHCWNMAWIDGSPVHLDITWDRVNDRGDVGYFYFNLTNEQITRDHRITTEGLPRCLDPTKGYHFREGTVFSTVGEASRFFQEAFRNDQCTCSIRLSTPADVGAFIQKAMRSAPVPRYRYQHSNTQRTALIWGIPG